MNNIYIYTYNKILLSGTLNININGLKRQYNL